MYELGGTGEEGTRDREGYICVHMQRSMEWGGGRWVWSIGVGEVSMEYWGGGGEYGVLG